MPKLMDKPAIIESSDQRYLFVCSANTCRSPLAAVIMRNEVACKLKTNIAGIERQGIIIRSAGPWARSGAGITPESRVVLAEMGYSVPDRGSRRLSPELIWDSTKIYAMTRWHVEQVLDLVPAAQDRVSLLDPLGRDIPDPIGRSQEIYRQVGRQIQLAVQDIVKNLF